MPRELFKRRFLFRGTLLQQPGGSPSMQAPAGLFFKARIGGLFERRVREGVEASLPPEELVKDNAIEGFAQLSLGGGLLFSDERQQSAQLFAAEGPGKDGRDLEDDASPLTDVFQAPARSVFERAGYGNGGIRLKGPGRALAFEGAEVSEPSEVFFDIERIAARVPLQRPLQSLWDSLIMAQQSLHVGGQVLGLQAFEGDSFKGLGNIEELLEVAGKAEILFPIEPAGEKEPWRCSRARCTAGEVGKSVQAQAVGPLEVIDGDRAGFAPGELHQEVGHLEVEALDGGARR